MADQKKRKLKGTWQNVKQQLAINSKLVQQQIQQVKQRHDQQGGSKTQPVPRAQQKMVASTSRSSSFRKQMEEAQKPAAEKHGEVIATVEPKSVKVKLPNPGTKEESFSITVNNHGPDRIMFKIRGTKQSTFRVAQTYGIIQSNDSKIITVQPNKFTDYNRDTFLQGDHFTVLVAPIPVGQETETNTRALWRLKPHPDTIKNFLLQIEWVKMEKDHDEEENEDEDDEPPEKKPIVKHREKEKTKRSHKDAKVVEHLKGDDLLGDIKVEPKALMVLVPCEGADKEMIPIFVSNPTDDRYIFKLKCTQIIRFKLHPPMGFIEPKTKTKIEFRPQKFDETDDYGFVATDYLTVVLGKVPNIPDLTPKDVWKKGNPHEPKNPDQHKIPIQYAMMETEKEIQHHARPKMLKKTDKGFSYSNQ